MADNLLRTPGSGETVRAVDRGSAKRQVVELDVGGDSSGSEILVTGRTVSTGVGAMNVDSRVLSVRVTATPTVSTSPAYSANDQVGGIMTFSGCARANGLSGVIVGGALIDKGKQSADLDLWLFRESPTLAGSDNAAFDLTDANLVTAEPVGYLRFATYKTTSSNGIARCDVGDLPLGFVCASDDTALYGVFVTRGTPTYASTSDLVLSLFIIHD